MNSKIKIITFFLIFLILTSSSLAINKHDNKENVRYLSEFLGRKPMELPPPKSYSSDNTKPFMNDVLIPDDYRAKQYTILAGESGPSEQQNAMFMVGKISVSIIFLESNGSIDVQTENWSNVDPARPGVTNRMADYVSRIQSGLNWFKSQNPNTRISWTTHSRIVETSYEPITKSYKDEELWMNEIINSLGYSGFGKYNNDLRIADGTHWALTILVVDSLNDPDGMFIGNIAGYYAGDYIVLTYDNDGWGVTKTDGASAHEIAHTFGAEDEYYPVCYCGGAIGFLKTPNNNCVSGCPEGNCMGGEPYCNGCDQCYVSNCLMENLNLCLTTSTKQQMGWRDLDNDGIIDSIDTTYNSWTDGDGDGVVDYMDNCPGVSNSNQIDTDNDWIGNACEDVTQPVITIQSPQNRAYTTSIPLTFTINEPTSWIGYSLDNRPNVMISGNTTLFGLSYGSHNVIVYANDTSSNRGTSRRVYFTVVRGGGGCGRGCYLI
jgi:hypothetical protein